MLGGINIQNSTITHESKTIVKKHRRFRPDIAILREIKKLQKTGDLLIKKYPFQQLIREICKEINQEIRFQSQGLLALQEAAEAFLVGLFEDCNLLALHCKRTVIRKKDLILALRLRGELDLYKNI